MLPVDFHFVYDVQKRVYRLIDPMPYYSRRFRKWITCPDGMESDGASGPATDIVSRGWWVHDRLCETFAWDDGTPCPIWQSSLVLYDILKEEGRPVRARSWFVATLLFGYIKKGVLMKAFIVAMVIAFAIMVCSGCTAYKVAGYNSKVRAARQMVQLGPQVAGDTWQVRAGVDLMQIAGMKEGYLGAWRDDFAGMLAAHITDIAAVAGAAYLYKESTDEKTAITEVEQPATYEIDAGTVIINRDGTVNFTGVP